jgi:ABC-type uncharacterized transport system involved in gliding motility auxiliary subunit
MFKKSNLGIGGIAVVGVLFVAIMLLANLLLRGAKLDLTADKLFTISKGTENIVQGLTEPVNLYLYFSEKSATPNPSLRTHATRVRDGRRAGVTLDGKLTLKVIDPAVFREKKTVNELGLYRGRQSERRKRLPRSRRHQFH